MINKLRMLIAESLLSISLHIAPRNKDGMMLFKHIAMYILEAKQVGDSWLKLVKKNES